MVPFYAGMGGWQFVKKKAATIFHPERLKILAYTSKTDRDDNTNPPDAIFKAMFNPESVKIKFENNWQKPQGIGTQGVDVIFASNKPEKLRFTLIFSRTGVEHVHKGWQAGKGVIGTVTTMASGVATNIISSASAVEEMASAGVSSEVRRFLKITTQITNQSHQPCYLLLQWGHVFMRLSNAEPTLDPIVSSAEDKYFSYPCRLESVDVAYTQFDRMGNPLRAELDTVFIEDGKKIIGQGLQSPDITHARTVEAGDTLPLMADRIYEDPSYYMKVAEANEMDSVRSVQPGESIVFPPIAK